MKINNTLLITKNDGTQCVFKVLFTHHSDTFNKDYAVFYNESDENEIIAYAFTDCSNLMSIETKEEFEELEKVLRDFDNQ
jgi:uncharacterized protein YrzB (UPF0473 family)